MRFKKFTYPGNYSDFSNGVPIKDSEINKWIDQGIEKLVKKIKVNEERKDFSYTIASGNTLVVITAYRQDNGTFSFHVRVCQVYMDESVYDIKI